jgi:small subunit ribosomal protein S20
MANIKSSKKDIRRSAERRARNLSVKSGLKTHIKKVRVTAAAEDVPQTQEALRAAIKAIDKAAQRGIIHKKQAARRKSRITKAANAAADAKA